MRLVFFEFFRAVNQIFLWMPCANFPPPVRRTLFPPQFLLYFSGMQDYFDKLDVISFSRIRELGRWLKAGLSRSSIDLRFPSSSIIFPSLDSFSMSWRSNMRNARGHFQRFPARLFLCSPTFFPLVRIFADSTSFDRDWGLLG